MSVTQGKHGVPFQRRHHKELPPAWPADRYEVVCERESPHEPSRDRYYGEAIALDAAKGLEEAGLSRKVWVIRLSDGAVVYDRSRGIELLSK